MRKMYQLMSLLAVLSMTGLASAAAPVIGDLFTAAGSAASGVAGNIITLLLVLVTIPVIFFGYRKVKASFIK